MIPEFEIGRVSIGLGNSDCWGNKSLAEAWIEIGPFRVCAHLHADGSCAIPPALQDDALRARIGAALRLRAIEAIQDQWAAATARDALKVLEREAATLAGCRPCHERLHGIEK